MPVFQPVLELATGRIAGYEALARMPEGPFRPPDQWFNQAHRAGLGPRWRPPPSGPPCARTDGPSGRSSRST